MVAYTQACFDGDIVKIQNGEYANCCFGGPVDRLSYKIVGYSIKVRVELKSDVPINQKSSSLRNDGHDGIRIKEGYCDIALGGGGTATCKGWTTSDGDDFYHRYSGCFEEFLEGERFDHCQYEMAPAETVAKQQNVPEIDTEPLCVVVECEQEDGCNVWAHLWAGKMGDEPRVGSSSPAPSTPAPSALSPPPPSRTKEQQELIDKMQREAAERAWARTRPPPRAPMPPIVLPNSSMSTSCILAGVFTFAASTFLLA